VRALEQIGGTSPWVVGGMLVFLVLLQVFQDGSIRLLTTLIGGEWPVYVSGSVLFLALVGFGVWWVRRHYRPRPRMVPRHGLVAHTVVLFLSPPLDPKNHRDGKGERWKEICRSTCVELERKLGEGADPAEVLRKSTISWRMPLEAVWAHAGTLRRVVVVPSKETREWIPRFADCVRALLRREVEVVDAAELAGKPEQGVDFGADLEGILELVDRPCAELERRGEPMDGVVIDVTGGTKLCSLAGLVATQPFRGRCIQYVFAKPGEPALVRIWDVTFELDQRRP